MDYIKSKDNNLIKYAVKLINSSKFRKTECKFVIEGLRLCKDATLSNVSIDKTLYTKAFKEKNESIACEIINSSKESFVVEDNIMDHLTDTKNPQGILCICNILDKPLPLDKINNKGKYIILENIQDPSNLGTIFRTAEALGLNAIIISSNSCDIYNPKVLRGSMGAIFRMPFFIADNVSDEIKKLINMGFKVYASVPNDSAEPITNINFSKGSIIAIGNEGNGLTEETINSCLGKCTIPMDGQAESLNVASAANIMMWEMMRKRE